MKFPTLPILAGFALLVTACGKKAVNPPPVQTGAESIVLAEKHFLPPVGTVVTKETTMKMLNAPMTVKAGPRELEGTATQTTSDKETIETLAKDKVRRVISSRKTTGKMTVNGKDQETPEKEDPLEGIPVIVERKGGKWSATLESGETPTPDQQKGFGKITKEMDRDSDFETYGDAPRKIGDKWSVDPGKLLNFGNAENVTGTYDVELIEVADFQGVRCAVVKAKFDFKGTSESEDGGTPMDMHLVGEAFSHRSIADMIDLDVEVNGTMTISGSPAQNVSIHIEGPTTITEKAFLKKP
ncbi:MAG: hypothetical protein ABIS50_26005 [Luteolibacter sp.]|uniref:hypothetical protein n=1 Tax=Luteolibacter sp. TaxID=1962973 RepID=UPI00326358BB